MNENESKNESKNESESEYESESENENEKDEYYYEIRQLNNWIKCQLNIKRKRRIFKWILACRILSWQ